MRAPNLIRPAALVLACGLAQPAIGPAHAVPSGMALPDREPVPQVLLVGDICGALGNCGILGSGVNPLPRQTLKPDIGRFDLGHDDRYGRYRYEQPDMQLNLDVPRMQPSRRVQPRYTGTKTLYRVGNLSAEHVDWCYARYKSYRAKDNSYQPEKGPRRTCVSPYR